MISKPIQVVDLFCGGGGFAEGAIQAGCDVVLSIDYWQPAIITHKLNHPRTPCLMYELGGDIPTVASLIRCYLTPGVHFHLHMSPPCQSLSNASMADSSDGLGMVDWCLELVEFMNPDSWTLENVLPLAKHLVERGIPFDKINAASYGVPQLRKRVFAGEGWSCTPSHLKEDFVSVLDALPGLVGELLPAASMKDRWSNLTVNQPFPTVTSQSIHQIRLESLGSPSHRSRDSFLDSPSFTICGSGHMIGPRLIEHDGDSFNTVRSLNLEETSILQGWSGMLHPSTPKPVRKFDLWKVIGNMVCPPVAKAIMEGV